MANPVDTALGIAATATFALGWLAIGYHLRQERLSETQAERHRAEVDTSRAVGFQAGDQHGYRQATRIIVADLARILDTPAQQTALDAYDQLGHANRKLAELDAYRRDLLAADHG